MAPVEGFTPPDVVDADELDAASRLAAERRRWSWTLLPDLQHVLKTMLTPSVISRGRLRRSMLRRQMPSWRGVRTGFDRSLQAMRPLR